MTDEGFKRVVEAKLLAMKHLPEQGDLSLIVLKGHLILEEILFTLVTDSVKHSDSIKSANLSFYQLASVAKALFYEEPLAPFWDALFQLNSLRNAFAHNLELPDLENRLRRFAVIGSAGSAEAGHAIVANPAQVMLGSIETMCGAFAAMNVVKTLKST